VHSTEKDGPGMNTTLESLELDRVDVTDDKTDLVQGAILSPYQGSQIFGDHFGPEECDRIMCCHLSY
jgi:hypothetical protein